MVVIRFEFEWSVRKNYPSFLAFQLHLFPKIVSTKPFRGQYFCECQGMFSSFLNQEQFRFNGIRVMKLFISLSLSITETKWEELNWVNFNCIFPGEKLSNFFFFKLFFHHMHATLCTQFFLPADESVSLFINSSKTLFYGTHLEFTLRCYENIQVTRQWTPSNSEPGPWQCY